MPLSNEQRHKTEEEINAINHDYNEGGIYAYLGVQFNATVALLLDVNLYPQQLWVPLVLGLEPLKPDLETVIKEEPEAQIKQEPNPQLDALGTPPHSPQLPNSPTPPAVEQQPSPVFNPAVEQPFFNPPETPKTPKHNSMLREAKALGIVATPITIRK